MLLLFLIAAALQYACSQLLPLDVSGLKFPSSLEEVRVANIQRSLRPSITYDRGIRELQCAAVASYDALGSVVSIVPINSKDCNDIVLDTEAVLMNMGNSQGQPTVITLSQLNSIIANGNWAKINMYQKVTNQYYYFVMSIYFPLPYGMNCDPAIFSDIEQTTDCYVNGVLASSSTNDQIMLQPLSFDNSTLKNAPFIGAIDAWIAGPDMQLCPTNIDPVLQVVAPVYDGQAYSMCMQQPLFDANTWISIEEFKNGPNVLENEIPKTDKYLELSYYNLIGPGNYVLNGTLYLKAGTFSIGTSAFGAVACDASSFYIDGNYAGTYLSISRNYTAGDIHVYKITGLLPIGLKARCLNNGKDTTNWDNSFGADRQNQGPPPIKDSSVPLLVVAASVGLVGLVFYLHKQRNPTLQVDETRAMIKEIS